jgi:hypothetical protein
VRLIAPLGEVVRPASNLARAVVIAIRAPGRTGCVTHAGWAADTVRVTHIVRDHVRAVYEAAAESAADAGNVEAGQAGDRMRDARQRRALPAVAALGAADRREDLRERTFRWRRRCCYLHLKAPLSWLREWFRGQPLVFAAPRLAVLVMAARTRARAWLRPARRRG